MSSDRRNPSDQSALRSCGLSGPLNWVRYAVFKLLQRYWRHDRHPSFVLTPALVSRLTVFRLEPLSLEDLRDVVARAVVLFKAKGISFAVEAGVSDSLLAVRVGTPGGL